jgi:glutathione peroxidase
MSRMNRRHWIAGAATATVLPLSALPFAGRAQAGRAAGDFSFASIDGGDYRLSDWAGRPILVVNTASLCAFTPQFDALQALHEAYEPAGLVVLAVPSDDFAQELGSDAEVADFCAVNFDLTLPMTTITHVRGRRAHPFYRWLREAHGFRPRWNFNKVLLDGSGTPVATFGSHADPMGDAIRGRIDALLRL